MRPAFVAFVVDGWTLVRGLDAKRVLTQLGHQPRWSQSGRGWAVPGEKVADDLQAWANYHGSFVTISHRRPT